MSSHTYRRTFPFVCLATLIMLILCTNGYSGTFGTAALAATQASNMVNRIIVTINDDYGPYRFYVSADGKDHHFAPISVPVSSDFNTRNILLAQGVYTGPGGKLDFLSPDKTQRLTVTTTHDTAGNTHLSMVVANADGSAPHDIGTLTGIGFIVPPAWSPDGSKVLVTEIALDQAHQQIVRLRFHVFGLTGKGEDQLVTPNKPISFPTDYLLEAMAYLGNQFAFWTPDGKRILTIGNLTYQANGFSLVSLDADGKNTKPFLADTSKTAYNASWSPDGQHLLFSYADSISSGEAGIATSDANGGNITSLADAQLTYFPVWSPDGSQIAFIDIGSDGHALTLWTMNANGSNRRQVFDALKDGQATNHTSTTPYDLEWSLVPQGILDNLPVVAPTAQPTAAATDDSTVSPDLATASASTPSADDTPSRVLNGHTDIVFAVAWSPDNKTIASAGWDHTVRLWDASTGKLLHTLTGHTDVIEGVAWSPDSKTVASASVDKTVRLWDAVTGKPLRVLKGHTSDVTNVAWSPDGKMLASTSVDRTIRLWNPNTGKALRTLVGSLDTVQDVVWSPDGNTLASASFDKTVRLWDPQTGKLLRTLTGSAKQVYSVSWSPDGKLLASSGEENTIRIWEVTTGKLLRTLDGHTGPVPGVAWSPDGKLLASASVDNTVRIWDPQTGRSLRTLTGHTSYVVAVSWSVDGTALASASGDHTVRVWDISALKSSTPNILSTADATATLK